MGWFVGITLPLHSLFVIFFQKYSFSRVLVGQVGGLLGSRERRYGGINTTTHRPLLLLLCSFQLLLLINTFFILCFVHI